MSARVHVSDVGRQINDIRDFIVKRLDRAGNGGWKLKLTQDVAPEGHNRIPAVVLEVHNRDAATEDFTYVKLDLTTTEARTLAAQLLHFADLEDLHRYDNR